MEITIRELCNKDRADVLSMMKVFYASDAVSSNGSDEIFNNDIDACLSDNPFLRGYVMEANGESVGYCLMAYSYSTEFGRPCVWLEDIYVKPEYHNMGIGGRVMDYFIEMNPNAILRLEVNKKNEGAIHVYEKRGFNKLSYLEMMWQ